MNRSESVGILHFSFRDGMLHTKKMLIKYKLDKQKVRKHTNSVLFITASPGVTSVSVILKEKLLSV